MMIRFTLKTPASSNVPRIFCFSNLILQTRNTELRTQNSELLERLANTRFAPTINIDYSRAVLFGVYLEAWFMENHGFER